jgi:hypothetical protein
MIIENILRDASIALNAALRHSAELSEINHLDRELFRMRVLITNVAAHTYTSLGDNSSVTREVSELQNVKEVILQTAKQRFGETSEILREFCLFPETPDSDRTTISMQIGPPFPAK